MHHISSLDHVYTSPTLTPCCIVSTGPDVISDHYPVYVDINVSGSKAETPAKVLRRNFYKPVYARVRSDIRAAGLHLHRIPSGAVDVNTALSDLLSLLQPVVDYYFPLQEIVQRRNGGDKRRTGRGPVVRTAHERPAAG